MNVGMNLSETADRMESQLTFPKNDNYSVPKGTNGLGVSGTASDPDDTVVATRASLDGGAYHACNGTTSWICGIFLSQLSAGKHTLDIIAIDSRGASSDPFTFRFITH